MSNFNERETAGGGLGTGAVSDALARNHQTWYWAKRTANNGGERQMLLGRRKWRGSAR